MSQKETGRDMAPHQGKGGSGAKETRTPDPPACKGRRRGELTWFVAVERPGCVPVNDRDSPPITVRSGTQRARPTTETSKRFLILGRSLEQGRTG